MRIDYENYKIYFYTQSALRRLYQKEILDKYLKPLAYLYQNGFILREDVESQMIIYNCFSDYEELENLKEVINYEFSEADPYSIGKKIISYEVYEILKKTTFFQKEECFGVTKILSEEKFDLLKELSKELQDLFNSKDIELAGAYKFINNIEDLRNKINDLVRTSNETKKVITFVKFQDLRLLLYSLYLSNGKIADKENNVILVGNVSDELYGCGGFNPNNREIKASPGSAVANARLAKIMPMNQAGLSKLKFFVDSILKETKGIKSTPEDEREFAFLEGYKKGYYNENERARKIVVNIMLNGILELLKLKHSFNLRKDNKNSERADKIKFEFLEILKYCNVDKEYLL